MMGQDSAVRFLPDRETYGVMMCIRGSAHVTVRRPATGRPGGALIINSKHLHGGPFRIVETDGNPVPAAGQWVKNTLNVGPGERYDVLWEAVEPGKWLLHYHINHHTTNNNVETEGGGGLMLILDVTE